MQGNVKSEISICCQSKLTLTNVQWFHWTGGFAGRRFCLALTKANYILTAFCRNVIVVEVVVLLVLVLVLVVVLVVIVVWAVVLVAAAAAAAAAVLGCCYFCYAYC